MRFWFHFSSSCTACWVFPERHTEHFILYWGPRDANVGKTLCLLIISKVAGAAWFSAKLQEPFSCGLCSFFMGSALAASNLRF